MNNNNLYIDWKRSFIDKVKKAIKSTKRKFNIEDAIDEGNNLSNDYDKVMIEYYRFIKTHPFSDNDFNKYLVAYKKGKRLEDKYFKYDLNLLYEYYEKIDEEPDYRLTSSVEWERYVLYMLLKFNCLYDPEIMDDSFNITCRQNREYNPLTNINKIYRGFLPESLKLVEYDIKEAFPTFIDIEYDLDRKDSVYDYMSKKEFNTLINTHNEIKGSDIKKVREKLRPIYGKKVNDVITEDRFNNKGKMYSDFTKVEEKYINKFVESNNIKDYVRLHDAVLVREEENINQTEFGKVVFNKYDVNQLEIINDLKSFYSFNSDGEVITSPKKYKDFFIQENFIRVTEEGNDEIKIFKDTNNVVEYYNYKTNLPSFLSSKINEDDDSKIEKIENKIAVDNHKSINQGLHLLPPKKLRYYRDDKDSFGLPFNDYFVKLSKGYDDLQFLNYSSLNVFFPKHNIQDHIFKETKDKNNSKSDFELFIGMISTGKNIMDEDLTENEQKLFEIFQAAFGYLIYTYKDPSFNKAIVLTDVNANGENRNGGKGKTIFGQAIAKVRKQISKGGKEFLPDYKHKFADLDISHENYLLDDVPASFDYNSLYTAITGGINSEKKGKNSIEIPFRYAPKFIITTNYVYRYDKKASSTNRRFMELKFSDYFNENNTPFDVFGKRLFDDWDYNEWNKFYNYCFDCVKLYFNEGLKEPKYDKRIDEYHALFNNEVVEDEFERIFNVLNDNDEGFSVFDFLKIYQSYDNPLNKEKYFHKNNLKNMIDAYIYKNKLDIFYNKMDKKWKNNSINEDNNGYINEMIPNNDEF